MWRYPVDKRLTPQVIKPLLKPNIARLKGSIGSLKPCGSTMESSALDDGMDCGGALVAEAACGAKASAIKRWPRTVRNRNLGGLFMPNLEVCNLPRLASNNGGRLIDPCGGKWNFHCVAPLLFDAEFFHQGRSALCDDAVA